MTTEAEHPQLYNCVFGQTYMADPGALQPGQLFEARHAEVRALPAPVQQAFAVVCADGWTGGWNELLETATIMGSNDD